MPNISFQEWYERMAARANYLPLHTSPPIAPHTEISIPIAATTAEDAMLKDNIDKAFAEMAKQLSTSLYGDHLASPRRPLTLRERLKAFRWRLHDAWLVLTGKADIYYDIHRST